MAAAAHRADRTREVRLAFAGSMSLHAALAAGLVLACLLCPAAPRLALRGAAASFSLSLVDLSPRPVPAASPQQPPPPPPLAEAPVQPPPTLAPVIPPPPPPPAQVIPTPRPPPPPVPAEAHEIAKVPMPAAATPISPSAPPALQLSAAPASATAGSTATIAAPSSVPTDTEPAGASPPALLAVSNIQPQYPLAAKLRGEEGLVRVATVVGRTGRVESAEVAESSGHPALDSAALAAARRARFTATRGRIEKPTPTTLTFRFRLVD